MSQRTIASRTKSLFRRASWMLEDQYVRFLSKRHRIESGHSRIYFYHIRKTGGTSLCHSLLGMGEKDGDEVYQLINSSSQKRIVSGTKVMVGYRKKLIEQGDYFFGFSHLPAHELNIPKDTFTLTCLRDPQKRLLSHYNMLVNFKKNEVPHACMKEEGPWLGNSFEDFLRNIPREHLVRQLYMFSQEFSITEAIDKIHTCNQVLILESLDQGLEELSNKIGLSIKCDRLRQSTERYEPTESEIEIMTELLEPEQQVYDHFAA